MIGSDIKSYLKRNGIKQSYIAEETGIPEPTLSVMLNGKRRIEVGEYFLICDALNVPLEQFRDKVETKNC